VIGGGFYGCVVALELGKYLPMILLVEKESDLMQCASYNNQARIHQGYHYPRSILTSLRSRENFSRFVSEFSDCVVSSFTKYYAIGRIMSKVNAAQFRVFCQRIGAPVEIAPKSVNNLFNPELIETVFKVKEFAFDAKRLKEIMFAELDQCDVELRLGTRIRSVASADSNRMVVAYDGMSGTGELVTKHVFNCTYSQVNRVLEASRLPLIPMKHEYTEMALVEPPDEISGLGITVMDGPFFSLMPFPARNLYSLSHVRYTPHHHWYDRADETLFDAHEYFRQHVPESRFVHMIKDVQRYLPAAAASRYVDSLWEVKTLLPRSEVDDSRPILYRDNERMPGIVSILGGKIDNIYDIRERIAKQLRARGKGI
jgi:glycine/D-amino acid oxidase-like deaminating enzyme